jgi:transposase-like protein
VAICGDTGRLQPLQVQLIALRMQGHSWTKCAAHLGISRETVRRWRHEFPEIEAQLREENEYHLVLARERLPAAVDAAVERLRLIVQNVASEDKDAVAAAKLLFDTVTKRAEEAAAGARDGAARERAGPELPAVVECEQFDDLVRPDQHAAR